MVNQMSLEAGRRGDADKIEGKFSYIIKSLHFIFPALSSIFRPKCSD